MGQLHFRDIGDYKFYKNQLERLQDPNNLPTTCTKPEFVNAVKQISFDHYNKLLSAYSSLVEFQFYWNTVNELDRHDEDFIKLVSIFDDSSEEIDDIFRRVAIARLEKPWLD